MPNGPGKILKEEILKLLNEVTEEKDQKDLTAKEE